MPPRLPFAACYVYSPHGPDEVSARSRMVRALLKEGNARFIADTAVRLRGHAATDERLGAFLQGARLLVPVPGCRCSSRVPVALLLAAALLHAGFGRTLWNGLARRHPVRKNATAPPGGRPTVLAHYESFVVAADAGAPARILLVDDVVTKGRTLLAAAARIGEAYPDADIRAFALLRTMGLAPGVSRLLDPCVGEIRWLAGDARREP